jgi:hypothetical protein
MAPELVKKIRVKIENDFIYFINNRGHLCKVKKVSIPGKKMKILVVKKLSIKKQPGYAYFLDQKGDVRKVFLEEGSKNMLKKAKKPLSKIKKKVKRKG